MRRIERTLTIVITTTWTISWRDDSLAPSGDPPADPAKEAFPDLSQKLVHDIQQIPTRMEAKEDVLLEAERVINQPADQLPDDPNFYPYKKGNEKP